MLVAAGRPRSRRDEQRGLQALLPLFVAEAHSARARRWLRRDPVVVVWSLTREFVMMGTDWPTMIVACWLLRVRIEGRERISVLFVLARACSVAFKSRPRMR